MGRPPCCDKVGIKKGPWTPEEDIILVSYIQEHGPGNWRSVPTNTGLLRCSKSCRLRWTNYLRPGIKRGNFTPHEEGMIIHLQALLGNKWAAIASYLPQRTDNDIKNYWNTHLKKKLKKFQSGLDHAKEAPDHSTTYQFMATKKENNVGSNDNSNSIYASSTENISRLLEGWMRSSANPSTTVNGYGDINLENNHSTDYQQAGNNAYRPQADQQQISIANDEFEPMLSFDSGMTCEKSCFQKVNGVDEKAKPESNPPLTFLEKWLLDETANQVEEIMGLPTIF